MNIKSLIYSGLLIAILLLAGSCKNDITDPLLSGDEIQLELLPSIAEMNEVTIKTRISGNRFFDVGDKITVNITTSREGATSESYTYTYGGDATFTGGFNFPPDNTYIKELVALWPEEGSEARKKVITDQRKYEDYKQANRLKAMASTQNIMPTAAPVPLLFEHEQSRMVFRMAGQNANGLIIKELLLELQADIDENETNKKSGFWAYCEEEGVLNARLILPSGSQFGEDSDSDGLMMIGLATVGRAGTNDFDYRGVIYIPRSTDIELEPNHDYLVTLTPEGFDLFATITIDGFPQSEGHVAIPYQLPVDTDGDGIYEISTVAQLVTISWLLAGDLNGELQTDWLAREFDIVSPIVVSAKIQAEKDKYLKASVLEARKGLFSNTNKVTYADETYVFGYVEEGTGGDESGEGDGTGE